VGANLLRCSIISASIANRQKYERNGKSKAYGLGNRAHIKFMYRQYEIFVVGG
jgi:hypothetical protein